MAAVAMLCSAPSAFARCDLAATDSAIYGYWAGSVKCSTLEEAEHRVRTGTNGTALPVTSLAFVTPVDFYTSPGSGLHLNYRPFGALSLGASVLTGAPVSTTPFFRTYAKNWPPTNASCPVAGCGSNGCSTPEQERQRLQCQLALTWAQDPRFCWGAGTVALAGTVSRFSRASGAGNESGSLLYAPSTSTANDSGASLSVTLQPCAATLGEGGRAAAQPVVAQPFIWSLARKDEISCGAGSTVNGSASGAANACSTQYEKSLIVPPAFTQGPNQCSAGNPCFPGNGNKTAAVEVFDYGRIALTLHYGSLRQLRNAGGIDRNWSHTFARRILTSWSAPAVFPADPEDTPIENVVTMYVQDEAPSLEIYRRDGTLPAGTFRATSSLGRTLRYIAAEGANPPRYELTADGGSVEVYDRAGRLVELRRAGDPAGRLLLQYRGRAITQPFVTETAHLEEAFWRIDRITDGNGRYVSFEYADGRNLPMRRIVADDGTELARFDLDAGGRLAALVRFGRSQQFLYNEPAHMGVAAGIAGAWLTGIVDEDGRRYATYQYDDWGRAIASWHGVDAGKVEILYPVLTPGGTAQDDSRAIVRTAAAGEVEYRFAMNRPYRQVSSIVDSAGTLSYEFQPGGHRVSARIDRRGVRTEFEYDPANSHTIAKIEAKGTPQQRRTEFDWDYATDRKTAERLYEEPAVGPRRLINDRRFRYQPGTAVLAGFDRVDPLDGRWRSVDYAYCSSADVANPATGCALVGQLKSHDGARTDISDVTAYAYYTADNLAGCGVAGGACWRKGDLKRITTALGHSYEIAAYDRAGRVVRVRDENGTLTDYAYHARGWLQTRTVRALASGAADANDAVTALEYDHSGNLVRQLAADNGGATTYGYDDAHRLITITDAAGNGIEFTPDRSGNHQHERRYGPDGSTTWSYSRQYNTLNQLTAELDAFSRPRFHTNITDAAAGVVDGHDANGNLRRLTDGRNVNEDRQYDALNRLVRTLQDFQGSGPSANARTDYGYDAADRLVSVLDADNVPTSYRYDGLGDLREITSRDSGSAVHSYDLAGNRITETDARGVVATHVYDALNRRTATFYPDLSRQVLREYDLADAQTGCVGSAFKGRLSRLSDASGSTTYCYDRRGNVTRKIRLRPGETLVGGGARQLHYAYYKDDQLRQIVYPHGAVVTYARNSNGQATGLSWQPHAGGPVSALVLGVSYYPFGPLRAITFGNAQQLVKTYDSNYAIDSVEGQQPGGLVLDLQTDVFGNVTSVAPTLGGPVSRRYTYDPLNRLTEMRDGANQLLEQYGYSPVGDRLSKKIGAQTAQNYSYQPGTHRLGSTGTQTRSYDANGNTTAGLGISSSPLIYDDTNRLSRLTVAGQGSDVTTHYAYDGLGQRVSKQSTTEGVDTLYDESGLRLVDETFDISCDAGFSSPPVRSGSSTSPSTVACPGGGLALITPRSRTEYLYLDGLPVLLARYTGSNPAVQLSYLHTDHLGTPRVAINVGTGTQQWRWDLQNTAFGDHLPVVSENGYELNMRYPGQFYDKESGLHHNYFRDYEPRTGRYIESDPIGLVGGPSTYAYVEANPTSAFDPFGLCSCGLPNSSAFMSNYPDYNTYTGGDVWRLIGGTLEASYGANSSGGVQNSCAARVSYGLNASGKPIPPGAPGANRNWNANNHRYIISARQMTSYLNGTYGPPSQTLASSAELIALRRGLGSGGAAIVSSGGHVAVVTGSYADPYVSAFLGDVWVLPGGNCSCP